MEGGLEAGNTVSLIVVSNERGGMRSRKDKGEVNIDEYLRNL